MLTVTIETTHEYITPGGPHYRHVTCQECGHDKAPATYNKNIGNYTVNCGNCKNIGVYPPETLGLPEDGQLTLCRVVVSG